MPLLSSYLLITTHTLTTLAASYLVLTHPALLTASSPVWIIGESMHIRPPPPSFSIPSEPLASAALTLVLAALSQLFFVGGLASIDANNNNNKENAGALAEQAAVLRASQASWMSLAATRVFVTGGLAMWIYLLKSERGMIIDTDTIGGVKGMGLLANSVVFTAALAEMLFWGYVWTVLKEEGNGLAKTIMQGREGRNAVLNQDGTVTWE